MSDRGKTWQGRHLGWWAALAAAMIILAPAEGWAQARGARAAGRAGGAAAGQRDFGPRGGVRINQPLAGSEGAPVRPRVYVPDRPVDMLHLTVDVTPDFRRRTIDAEATLRFVPLMRPLASLSLNAIRLNVHRVSMAGRELTFQSMPDRLVIAFDPPLPPGREAEVRIAYDCEPREGIYFRTRELGYPAEDEHLFTQGEEELARNWIPCYDYPNERLTTEIIAHVPADMIAVANGRLVGESGPDARGLRTFHWLHDKPHTTYLIAMVAGKFKKIEGRYGELPLAFYVPASQIDYAAASFAGTDDMIRVFEAFTGTRFPWDRYDQAVVYDFVAGGMENTTLTILTDATLHPVEYEPARSSQNLVAHELAHQWFGDYVTCKEWAHTWINEGFATFCANLYEGARNGRDAYLVALYNANRQITRNTDTIPIVNTRYADSREQFSYRNYAKAGFVIHMLRSYLGEEVFGRCLKAFLDRYAYQSVDTDDFQSVFEEVSQQPLDRFFDQWLYHGGFPQLTVQYEWLPERRQVRLTVEQTQTVSEEVPLYDLSTTVRIDTPSGSRTEPIRIDQRRNVFTFDVAEPPTLVRFDPDLRVMGTVQFDLPEAMMREQARRADDVVGRLMAVEYFRERRDRGAVAELARMVNEDPFYAVRAAAASALGAIRSEAALAALLNAGEQSDLRVRLAVLQAIGGYFHDDAFERVRTVAANEPHGMLRAAAIEALAKFAGRRDVATLLRRQLRSESFRNEVAASAIAALRDTQDPAYLPDIVRTLRDRGRSFPSRSLAQAFQAVASLGALAPADSDARKLALDYLVEQTRQPASAIATGAVQALATLGDARAIPAVAALDGGLDSDPLQRAARAALEQLRARPEPPTALTNLQNEVRELREQLDQLRGRIDEMSRRGDQPEAAAGDQGGDRPEASGPRAGRGGRGRRGGAADAPIER